MRLSQIDLNLFIVFDAIYQQRNLTRAAEILCITQPAVSNALGRLRNTLNDPLFVRTSQGMSPTPMAEDIVGRVQEALQLLSTSITEGEVFLPETAEKVFRLSMNDMAEAMILPGLMEHLQTAAPHISVECYNVPREQVERELAAGTLDFALDVPLISGNQVCTTPLIKQRYACMVRKHHSKVGDTLTLDQYLSLDHIAISSRRKGLSYVDMALNRLGRRRTVKMRVQHYQVAPMLVASTDLALTIPMSMAQKYDMKVLELPFSLPALDWNLYWHTSADQDKANIWMRGLLEDLCQ
jgi:DNA-binding transcriptional LysR family regulator